MLEKELEERIFIFPLFRCFVKTNRGGDLFPVSIVRSVGWLLAVDQIILSGSRGSMRVGRKNQT